MAIKQKLEIKLIIKIKIKIKIEVMQVLDLFNQDLSNTFNLLNHFVDNDHQ